MKKRLVFFMLFFVFGLLCACSGPKHFVQFMSDDELVEKVFVKDGKTVESIEVNKGEGYKFLGWFDGEELFDFSQPINVDYTLEAKWERIKCHIVFQNSSDDIIEEKDVFWGDEIVAPTPVKASDDNYDYVFSSWDKEFNLANEDLVITALYNTQTRSYLVTYYSEDGSILQELKVTKGEKAKSINMTKENDDMYTYSFSGWYTQDGERFVFSNPRTMDFSLSVP